MLGVSGTYAAAVDDLKVVQSVRVHLGVVVAKQRDSFAVTSACVVPRRRASTVVDERLLRFRVEHAQEAELHVTDVLDLIV